MMQTMQKKADSERDGIEDKARNGYEMGTEK